ncbi:MAG: VaFE repeat-containing surface-anchored protein [Lachnospiraceae bacterium]|nr:VaFE repeat-containing surface-anchored protein [Lachnospiraceae bacterium]
MKKRKWKRYIAWLLCIVMLLPLCRNYAAWKAYAKSEIKELQDPVGNADTIDQTDMVEYEDTMEQAEIAEHTESAVYEGPLDWLNYLEEKQVMDTFGMSKQEVADYLNEIWSHPEIEPEFESKQNQEGIVGGAGASTYLNAGIMNSKILNADRMWMKTLRFMNQNINDEGDLSLSNGKESGEWYNGPFGYRTSHFSVTVDGNTTEAYCIDPSADTPPSGSYNYYIHEGGESGTATYAAASILYQNEYQSEVFCTKWEEAMNLAEVPEIDRNRFDLSNAGSRYFMVHSLVSNCWHAGEIWDAGESTGAYEVAGHQEFKNAFSAFYTMLLLAGHPKGFQVYFIYTGEEYQNVIFSNYKPYGKIKVTKQSQNIQIQNDNPDIYSLDGAEYAIYETLEDASQDLNRKEILIIADGTACSSELPAGVYYVREIKASKGYLLNPEILTAEVVSGNVTDLTSVEMLSSVRVVLRKQSSNPEVVKNHSLYSLAGAEYQVYKDAACTEKATALVYEKDKVTGTINALLITNKDGSTNELYLPRRTYYVKEIKASPGYQLDPEVKKVDLNQINVDTYTFTSVEEPETGRLKLLKIDAGSGYTFDNLAYDLSNARYLVSYSNKPDGMYQPVGEFCTDSHGRGIVTRNIWNQKNVGEEIMDTLPFGHYKIEEIESGNGYMVSNEIQYCQITDSNYKVVETIISMEQPMIPKIRITKKSSVTGLTRDHPLYSLEGAEYYIYTDPECTVRARSLILNENGVPMGSEDAVFTTDVNGNSNTLCMLPGTYYVKEIKESKGYLIDPSVYPVVLSADNRKVITLECQEIPLSVTPSVSVIKEDVEGITFEAGVKSNDQGSGSATLEGAVFSISYYQNYYLTNDDLPEEAEAVWYIMTIYNPVTQKYEALLDEKHLVEEYTNSDFYRNADGDIVLPLGTIVIRENQAPEGYRPLVEEGFIKDQGGIQSHPYDILQIRYSDDDKDGHNDHAHIYAGKEQKDNTPSIVYTVKQDNSSIFVEEQVQRGDFHFVKTELASGNEMDYVFFRVTSPWGESHIICTKNGGLYESSATAHSCNTNAYDKYYDVNNHYLGPNNPKQLMKEIDEAGECGLWFYGTEDSSLWNPDLIRDDKGALRYDARGYLVEELSGPCNQGKQLSSRILMIQKDRDNVWMGNIANIDVPELQTREWDQASQGHVSAVMYDCDSSVIDTIDYRNLPENSVFTVKGLLMELNKDGEAVGPLVSSSGDLIQGSSTIRTGKSRYSSVPYVNGSIDVEYEFPSSNLSGKRFVIYEYLFEGEYEKPLIFQDGEIVTEDVYEVQNKKIMHADPESRDQSGNFLSIHTHAEEEMTGSNIAEIKTAMRIKDIVDYESLTPGYEYKLYAELVYRDKETDEIKPILDAEEQPITAVRYFIPESEDGSVTVEFPEFDGYQLVNESGERISTGITVYETLYWNNRMIAAYKDITDDDETVFLPSIHTSANDADTGSKISAADSSVTIIDTCIYENLIPGHFYKIQGVLMDQQTGVPLRDDQGAAITSEVTFMAEEAEGSIDLIYTFDGSLLKGKTVVVFEDIYYRGHRVASHADLSDESQTVHFPSIHTKLTDSDGRQELLLTDNTKITLTDQVQYHNLLPGREYILQGTLINKATGKPIVINDIPVTSEVSFTVNQEDEVVSVEFSLDVNEAGLLHEDGSVDAIVCYEEVIDSFSRKKVADHKDIEDEGQTVHFLQRGRVRLKKTADVTDSVKKQSVILPGGKQLIIMSLRSSSKAYEGITFTVYDSGTDQKVTTFQTDEEGNGYSDDLIYGDGRSYYLKETDAPPEYKLDPESYPILFTSYNDEEYYSETEQMEFHNQTKQVRIMLHKQKEQIVYDEESGYKMESVDAANVYYGVYNLEELILSSNTVIPKDSLLGIMVTDENGYAEINDFFPAGSYYCKELQTSGEEYILDDTEYEFQIHYDMDSKEDCIIDLTPDQPIINRYVGRKLLLHKVDDQKESIPGVEFALFRRENDGDRQIGSYITDQNGEIIIDWLPYGEYYFKETNGVSGFEFDGDKEYEFMVKQDMLKVSEENASESDGHTISLEIVNKRIPESPKPKPPKSASPKTGDYRVPIFWLSIMGLALFAYAVVFSMWSKPNRKRSQQKKSR